MDIVTKVISVYYSIKKINNIIKVWEFCKGTQILCYLQEKERIHILYDIFTSSFKLSYLYIFKKSYCKRVYKIFNVIRWVFNNIKS